MPPLTPVVIGPPPNLHGFSPDANIPIPAADPGGRGTRWRNATIAATVIAVHAALLAVLAAGASRGPVDIVIPAMVVSESLEPAPRAREQEASRPQAVAKPVPRAVEREPLPPTPEPKPVATEASATEPASAAIAPSAQPSAMPRNPALAPAAPPAPPRIELPSASAAYLDNPAPEYPRLSRRLREQGTVTLRVLIGADGHAAQAQVETSSGFERLDHAALQAVRSWKYLPGKRNGVPEAMWFNVPVKFVLE